MNSQQTSQILSGCAVVAKWVLQNVIDLLAETGLQLEGQEKIEQALFSSSLSPAAVDMAAWDTGEIS